MQTSPPSLVQLTIARAIWRYQECPWDFDKPDGAMAELQKKFAMDEANYIIMSIYYHSRFAICTKAVHRKLACAVVVLIVTWIGILWRVVT